MAVTRWPAAPDPVRTVVTDGAVHKHIRSIFAKLDLASADRTDRRVGAVLHHLEDARRQA